MFEFAKLHYFEIAIVLVVIYLLFKVKRTARKLLALIFSLASIARVITMLMNF